MNMPFVIQRGSAVPMHQQLREQIIEAIETGRFAPGQKMPSSRVLSRELRLSRVVVVQCYDSLTSMGYLDATTGSGSYVRLKTTELTPLPTPPEHPQDASQYVESSSQKSLSSQLSMALRRCTYIDTGAIDMSELNYGAAPAQHLPTKSWKKLLLNLLKKDDQALQYDCHPLGSIELRDSICSYVRRARGVNCSPSQIAMFSSSQMSLSILMRLLLDKGDHVAVENPGFGHARKLASSCGAELVPIDVDEEGMRIDQLKQLETIPKLLYVTPSHHDPSGVVMSINRRKEILAWAEENNVLLIEDDYDSEYRYCGQPLPSIQSFDTHGHVIYLANFWKVLFPYVTMGYLILPPQLVGQVAQAKSCTDRAMPFLEQIALSKFISSGALEHHIHKTKRAFTVHRQELIFSIARNFGKKARMSKESAGMHLLFSLESEISEQTIMTLAHNAGIAIMSTRNYYFSKPRESEFLISFSNLKEGEIGPKMFMFAAMIKQAEQELIGDVLAVKVQEAQAAIFSHFSAPERGSIAYLPFAQ